MRESLKFVFIIQIVCGTTIALLALCFVIINFNTADLCISNANKYSHLPRTYRAIKTVGTSVKAFFAMLSGFFLLSTVFTYAQLRQANITLINIIAAFLSAVYILVLFVFDISLNENWIEYPIFAISILVIVFNGVKLAMLCIPLPRPWPRFLHLSFTFSAQFVLVTSYTYFMCYSFWPWFNKQKEFIKFISSALSPLIFAFPKLVCRLAAQKLKVIHPGSSHVFVSAVYGATVIIFRMMQAELSHVGLFIALGIVHSFIDLVERLTVIMRDYIWEYLYLLVRCKRRRRNKYSSPRSRRFVADMSIQILLQEATGLVIGLGFKHLYHFAYSDVNPPYTDFIVLVWFAIRVTIGLTIDLFFNTISLLVQMRFMNIAVVKVWKHKWRHHCLVMCIVAMATMIIYATSFYQLERYQSDGNIHPSVRFARNCSTALFTKVMAPQRLI